MRRCRRRVQLRLHLRWRIRVVAVLRMSMPLRTVVHPAAPRSRISIPEKPGLRAGLFVWANPGSVRVQFKKVLREQISSIVRCLLKAVSIHSGQRGYGRTR